MIIFFLISNWPPIQKKKDVQSLKIYTDKIERQTLRSSTKSNSKLILSLSLSLVNGHDFENSEQTNASFALVTSIKSRQHFGPAPCFIFIVVSFYTFTSSESRKTVLKLTLLSILSNCFIMPYSKLFCNSWTTNRGNWTKERHRPTKRNNNKKKARKLRREVFARPTLCVQTTAQTTKEFNK